MSKMIMTGIQSNTISQIISLQYKFLEDNGYIYQLKSDGQPLT